MSTDLQKNLRSPAKLGSHRKTMNAALKPVRVGILMAFAPPPQHGATRPRRINLERGR